MLQPAGRSGRWAGVSRTPRRRRAIAALLSSAVAFALGPVLAGAGDAAASTPSASSVNGWSAANPLDGRRLWVDPNNDAAREIRRRAGDTTAVTALKKIATRAQTRWFGDWVPTSQVRAQVSSVVTAAATASSVPVLVLYALPQRTCSDPSSGVDGPSAYASWVRQVAAGIGTRRAAVVVEPDALALLDCLSSTKRRQRVDMIRGAVATLRSLAPRTAIYLDAGHSSWVSVATMASRLRAAGVAGARGFSLNVSNFRWTRDEVAFGNRLSSALGGAHFVVDTSRNGLGPASGDMAWCNPRGRALGPRPTTATASSRADAYLWIKPPGQSDGSCGRGDPSAGSWWAWYAIGLAQRAAY